MTRRKRSYKNAPNRRDDPGPGDDNKIISLELPLHHIISVRVHRVVDGDSLFVKKMGSQKRIKVRVANISSPEKDTPQGDKAKAFFTKLLPRNRRIKLNVLQYTHKYRRFISEIMIGDTDVASEMIRSSLPYRVDVRHKNGIIFSPIKRLYTIQNNKKK